MSIQVDDKPLAEPEAARLWRYHKPSGLVTTHKDEKGRPTVFANLPKHLGRVVSVGRLDFNSEGLLLLTNDGEIARRWKFPPPAGRASTAPGCSARSPRPISTSSPPASPSTASNTAPSSPTWSAARACIAGPPSRLKEGKNREVKRVMERLGLKVARLIRTAYGPFQLGQLAEGQVEEIPARLWREKLGIGRKKRADREQ